MKKKLLILLLVILSLSLAAFGIAFAKDDIDDTVFTEESRDVEVGYLLRENFSIYDSAGSGWVEQNMPAGAGISNVYSTNTTLETSIKKDFVEQTGTVETEIVSSICMNISNGYFGLLGKVKGKEVVAVKFSVENDTIKYVDNDGVKTDVGKFSFDYSVGIKIVASAENDKATVYINGEKLESVTNVSFNENVDTLSGIIFCITKDGTGGFNLQSLCIRKGYSIFENFSTVGVVESHEQGYDYNSGSITTNVTVNDHSIQNDNNSLAPLCYDNNDNTYWKHNTQYSITQNVYFMMQYGKNISVDYLYIKFHKYYQGAISCTYKSPSGSWTGFGDVSYLTYETTDSNEYALTITSSKPITLVELAIGFQIGTKPYNIASGQIEVSSIVVRCDHPNEVDINTYPTYFVKEECANSNIYTSTLSGDRLLCVDDNNNTEVAKTYIPFNQTGDITVDFKTYLKNAADGNRFGIYNSDGNFIGFETKNGYLQFVEIVSGEKNYTKISNEAQSLNGLPVGIWTNLIFKFNSTTSFVSVDYNGWSPIEDISLNNVFKNSTWVKFEIKSSEGKTSFDFDDLKIFKTLPESNVPELEACDTGDTILTMQVCSLWREGTHTNYQVLDYEDGYERKTVLGWYDEGTAEVADWEIKIARDHGISNFMYCWYRKGTSTVKDSNYSDAIWDGLFKSKFREDMNFTIMFENSSSSMYSYDDLITNLMPYWIEVFFKNPNYQKTADGKPILYVYAGDMLNTVGDLNSDGKKDKEDMKIVTNKMRQMCVEAGFPGLYIAAEVRQKSSSQIKIIEDYGYDSIFAYCWTSGQQNVSDDYTLAYSEDMLLNQMASVQDPENFTVLPNISRCWDPSAWMDCGFNPQGATYAYDLEHYREFCLWVKDVFGAQSIDDQGTKMVMLDNWNEYAEGHWLMPSYGLPSYKDGRDCYGFLDILREVFGINEYEHTDYLPLEDGFGPYDTWYPKGWDKPADEYSPIFGKPVDESIVDNTIIDWTIGYNTLGGETIYVNSLNSDVISATNANRVYISNEVVKFLKENNKSLTINMLYGDLVISKEEIAKLNYNKSIEIVLNRLNDVTDTVIELRKKDKYLANGYVADFSIKQGGYTVDIVAKLTLKEQADSSKIVTIDNSNVVLLDLNNISTTTIIIEK